MLWKLLNMIRSLLNPGWLPNVPSVNIISKSSKLMTLNLKRNSKTSQAVMGELFASNNFVCFTLEHPTLSIPTGTYPIHLEFSPRFQMMTPHLSNVPGRTMIEIHPGNTMKNTEGCILVGMDKTTDAVLESRRAYQVLMDRIDFTQPLTLTITENPIPED
jgi:hypothetical protein